MNKKFIIISIISVAIIFLLASVLVIGGKNYMDKNQKETELAQQKINLENQRKAALIIRKKEPNASKVVFTSEGYFPGFGVPWTASTDVTIGGEVFRILLDSVDNYYSVRLGTNIDKMNKYNEVHNKKTSNQPPLEVTYHNGQTEVIK